MPNQQAQKNLHSENYYLSFPDGVFSKNFLDFTYQNEEQWNFPPGTGGSSDRSYFCQNAIGHT